LLLLVRRGPSWVSRRGGVDLEVLPPFGPKQARSSWYFSRREKLALDQLLGPTAGWHEKFAAAALHPQMAQMGSLHEGGPGGGASLAWACLDVMELAGRLA
jgi:hypothetical protein